MNEIFPILSSVRARTNVMILVGKCGSGRRSTTSFSENVVAAIGENKLSSVRDLFI